MTDYTIQLYRLGDYGSRWMIIVPDLKTARSEAVRHLSVGGSSAFSKAVISGKGRHETVQRGDPKMPLFKGVFILEIYDGKNHGQMAVYDLKKGSKGVQPRLFNWDLKKEYGYM